ncbi:hypothetical protein SUSAZ_06475 [Sulfolobus acidocaldarius SUSAZ]|nr:hypothetical protein SUSAZ_06475 [Sulfolobus acidocaldarius SUSAZ]
MIIKFFKRDNDDRTVSVSDDYGEWLIIRRDKQMITVKKIIDKTLKKLKIKNGNIGFIEASKDENFKDLVSFKAMISFQEQIKDVDFFKTFKEIAADRLTLGEMRVSKLRLCSTTFLFLNLSTIIRETDNEENNVKLLFPPKGVYSAEIPYALVDLFSKIIERNAISACNPSSVTVNGETFESVFLCKGVKGRLDEIKDAFTYFSYEEPIINLKNSGNRIELNVTIKKFKSKYLIPLLWNNIVISHITC